MLYEITEDNIYFEVEENIINIEEDGTPLEILNINPKDIEDIRINYNVIEIFTKNSNYLIEFIEMEIANEIYNELKELLK